MNSKYLIISILLALGVIVGASALILRTPVATEKTLREIAFDCVSHGGISYHIHSNLEIAVDGKKEEVQANIGITPQCMNTLHTHDGSGTVHIEYPTEKLFTWGDFFAVWKKPILREGFTLKATVNGKEITDPENQVIKNEDEVSFSYTSTSA